MATTAEVARNVSQRVHNDGFLGLGRNDSLKQTVRELKDLSKDERNAAINSRLCIELSSQSLIYDPEGSQAFLKDLRLMSVHSGIDLIDSETNQIPIHMLAQLSVRHIRLDGRRFTELATNLHAQREITAIRTLCESMGIECLLDQVNNPLDLRPLKELGIDLVQGSALAAVRPLGDVLAGREEEGLLPAGVMIPV